MARRPFNDGVDWKTIDQEGFDRLVEALLTKVYDHPPHSELQVLRGAGGDDGIDAALYLDGELVEIFQLKYFPEGFSKKWVDRRAQIKKSFEKAWKEHHPPRWTLITPANPSKPETVYVAGLPGNRECRPRVVGQHWLDAQISNYPELTDYALKNNLLEAVAQYELERIPVTTIGDILDRTAGLGQQTKSMSLNWAVNFNFGDSMTSISLVPKHPRAFELEPLTPQISLRFSEEHQDLRKQYFRTQDYGVRKPLTLPADVVQDFRISGADWLEGFNGSGEVVYLPTPQDPRTVKLTFTDKAGRTISSHLGTLTQKSSGTRGIGLTATFYDIIELDFEAPRDVKAAGTISSQFNYDHATISNAVRALELHRRLATPDNAFELWIDNKMFIGARVSDKTDDFPTERLTDLIEDLDILSRALHSDFQFPPELSERDRVRIRIARLLTERKATWMLPGTEFIGYLNNEATEGGLELILRQKVAIRSDIEDLAFEVLGVTFNFGRVMLYHPAMKLTNPERMRAALQQGTAEGLELRTVAVSKQLVMAIPIGDGGLNLESTDPDERIHPFGWGLPGLANHPGNTDQPQLSITQDQL